MSGSHVVWISKYIVIVLLLHNFIEQHYGLNKEIKRRRKENTVRRNNKIVIKRT